METQRHIGKPSINSKLSTKASGCSQISWFTGILRLDEQRPLGFLQCEREVSYVLGPYVFSGEIDACNVHVCASDRSNGKIARECENRAC